MASNSFGEIFRFTTWGESHGKAIGCVIDGVPPGLDLQEQDIQQFLDKRKPGNSAFTSPRKEQDKAEILSGVFQGKTIGSPISIIIYNHDQRSQDYDNLKNIYRPGHGDYVYQQKFGFRDYRGGGRASARETACRVIAGAVARKILSNEIKFNSAIVQIGNIKSKKLDMNYAQENNLYCPDKKIYKEYQNYLESIINAGDSIGAIVRVEIDNVPLGLGEPIYKKLNAKLADAIISVNSVKGVDFGLGFTGIKILGSDYQDQLIIKNGKEHFSSNNEGGITAGISNGQKIILHYVTKPPSSIKKTMQTINDQGQQITHSVGGRHDPLTVIRAIPVVEAMCACVLADMFLFKKAIF